MNRALPPVIQPLLMHIDPDLSSSGLLFEESDSPPQGPHGGFPVQVFLAQRSSLHPFLLKTGFFVITINDEEMDAPRESCRFKTKGFD